MDNNNNILVTGAKGFIGKNLTAFLRASGYKNIKEFDAADNLENLYNIAADCDFVFHLAGANRPVDTADFQKVNAGLTANLLKALKKNKNKVPVLMSSSIQAELDNEYGKSKKAAENLVFEYSKETGAPVFVYRLPNVFGKWCRPNYNSVVATFCNNIAHGEEIKINDRNTILKLVYVDDVIKEFVSCLNIQSQSEKYCKIKTLYEISLGEIADIIKSFSDNNSINIPPLGNEFTKKLYSTYLTYLPEDKIYTNLKKNSDQRGSFTEILKFGALGQVSINISNPGITKGNHWHNTKTEKFCVVAGNGIIRQRKLGSDETIESRVSGDNPQIIEILPGYTHNIENTGTTDMITLMWANELFDAENPDTFFEVV